MKLKTILLASALTLSATVSSANVFATGETIDTTTVSSSAIHVDGGANAGTIAVAITVYEDDTKAVKLAGPETTSVASDNTYSYDVTGGFDTSKTYYVCVADFNGGAETCETTTVATTNPTTPTNNGGQTATVADTGVAPKQSDTKDAATRNISFGISIAVASAILYGLHLFITHKKNA